MADAIAVLNAGSSSFKFSLFADSAQGLSVVARGQAEGLYTSPRFLAKDGAGATVDEKSWGEGVSLGHAGALDYLVAFLRQRLTDHRLVGAGHRVVHGGPEFAQPVRVDAPVLAALEKYVPLAPLHQPHNLAPIRSLLNNLPGLPQVACFDTAFHRDHDAVADHYAIPYQLHAEGVRRYGFHGLSYEYIAKRLPQIAPEIAGGRVIVAHLGSGASMCALKAGKSVESTMGFTALDGLAMGTRPGQLDPGVVLYLISEKGMSASSVQNFLYRDCGLKGLSGVSNDMRELETSSDPRAAFAIDYFVYRIGLNAGMLAAALQGLDAFVFTAGIGENSVTIRARIAEKLAWLGVALDPAENARHASRISQSDSRIPVYVVPTDEELMIAQHTLALLMNRQPPNQKRERVS
jgi:acetate kinase